MPRVRRDAGHCVSRRQFFAVRILGGEVPSWSYHLLAFLHKLVPEALARAVRGVLGTESRF